MSLMLYSPPGLDGFAGRSPLYAAATKDLKVQTFVANDDLSQYKLDLEACDRKIAALKISFGTWLCRTKL